ncbi:aspartyl protease family protein [Flavisolibacter nicotianae]|uniref:aspartyl protease family protein n=1 Tax=Flavisolibacter nicotianae TaxID=2364882 RepID=UPI001F09A482
MQSTAAQEEFVVPSRFITKFPFVQLTGGIILLQGRFDKFKDTLNFILDTGSGGISLDSTTADYFGVKPEPSSRTIRGIAGVRNVSFLNNKKLHLPGLTIDSLNFHVSNYDILTAVYGERIDGIIGYSVFSRYIVRINYDSTQVEFWTKGTFKYPRGGHLLRPAITALPVQVARLKDNRAVETRFLIDMGAGLNVLFSRDFIKDSNVLRANRKLYTKEAEGLGGKVDMQVTVLKEFRIGPYKFRNMPVNVFDDEFNVTSYPHLGGLIGNDLLRRFNVVINYEQKEFHLLPNSHFYDPFDYAYSGIELYLINGRIIIGDVAKDSPAESAGVREGDVVVAINKNFIQNISLYKATLQSANEGVNLILLRDGQLQEFKFKVKNILKNQ